MSWTSKASDAGHWAQVVDAEGGNKLISDGCWKFEQKESTYQILRNQTAPRHSFLATALNSPGDTPSSDSLFTELIPNETTNKPAENGLWSFAGSANAYNLVNKEFNFGANFLSLAATKTTGGKGQSTYLQVVSAEDTTNTKGIQGSLKITGPYN